MKSGLVCFVVALAVIGNSFYVEANNAAYVCSFCIIAFGLVEQASLQVHLERGLITRCGDSLICQRAVKELVTSLEKKAVPEDLCAEMELCTVPGCKMYSEWPADPLPSPPPAWPIERKLLSTFDPNVESSPLMKENIMEMDLPRKLTELKKIFEDLMVPLPEEWGMWAHVTMAMGHLMHLEHIANHTNSLAHHGEVKDDPCGFNITCKITAISAHKPIQDHDGDLYSVDQMRRLRGSDWRGSDCDDLHADVYPGRSGSKYGPTVDHNCNGIVGGNETASYEELFCKNSQPRGIAILGDSATAHFHIPPQWLTADGWNLDQLLPDALNEIDQPHCSWGTGHRSPEECPFQYPISGVNGVLSLYSQLRERNRCNHNDFQNIGVNGARMTSSDQLVTALARNPTEDNPLLVWLALIGNDICNGHPDFTHMTKPEVFYEHAMSTLTRLDGVVPKGSHVVALALFDGELLYSTMHRHTHPLGTKYQQAYDFMNCLEENPCWGWLNSNETVRRISTVWSNNLNRVYQNISNHQNFQNFKFIFYSPKWVDIFSAYADTGRPLTDLIEPSDGFHPSQTGNAIFAQSFFKFLVDEHPEAVGPVNPYNAEIDALFFNQQQQKKLMV